MIPFSSSKKRPLSTEDEIKREILLINRKSGYNLYQEKEGGSFIDGLKEDNKEKEIETYKMHQE